MIRKYSQLQLNYENVQPLLDNFEKEWLKQGVESILSFEKFLPAIVLNKIIVPKEKRGLGLGSKYMKALCKLADSLSIHLALTPDTSYGGSSVSRLTKFYSQFGFVKNSGRKRNFKTRETMLREPQI